MQWSLILLLLFFFLCRGLSRKMRSWSSSLQALISNADLSQLFRGIGKLEFGFTFYLRLVRQCHFESYQCPVAAYFFVLLWHQVKSSQQMLSILPFTLFILRSSQNDKSYSCEAKSQLCAGKETAFELSSYASIIVLCRIICQYVLHQVIIEMVCCRNALLFSNC